MNNTTPFAELAQLGERLEQTRKRKELAALVAEFLLALSHDEIPPAVRLIIGQVFAEWDGRALNLSSKAVSAVVDTLVDATDQQRSEIYAQAVDPGEATRMLLEQARRRGGSAGARVQIRWFVTAQGNAIQIRVQGLSSHDDALAHALADLVRRWQFPKPRDGRSVRVTYVLTL